MGQARSYQEQVIVQSLLLRSLGVLHHVYSSASCTVAADAVMLLDIEDGRARPRVDDPQSDAARSRMRTLPACKQRVDAEERLMHRALDQDRRDILCTSFDDYLDFFSDLFKAVSKHRQNVLKLDTLRTEVLIRGAAEKSGDGEPLDAGLVETLHLTKWQLRMLAVAVLDTPGILTDRQEDIRRGMLGRGKTHDLSQYKPVVAVDDGPMDMDADNTRGAPQTPGRPEHALRCAPWRCIDHSSRPCQGASLPTTSTPVARSLPDKCTVAGEYF